MATNAFDYWKRRAAPGSNQQSRYAAGLDQNPANREWQIRTAASRLTPISSASSVVTRHSPTSATPSGPFASAVHSGSLHTNGTSNTSSSAGTVSSPTFESLEPDQIIATLHRLPTNGSVFAALRKKLASKHPQDKWIDAFCKADGVHFLLDAWKSTRDKPVQKLSDAYFQRECMECLKVAIDSPVTMDYISDDVESQDKILSALDSSNAAVRKQAMDVLSSLCAHNQEAYGKAVEIFERYKAEKHDSSRFQLLVDELRQAKTSAYKTTLITLVNAVICNNEALRSRIRIRNEFLALKLHNVLAHIRTDANPDDAELFIQLDTFDEQKFSDEANLSSPDGLDLTNLMDVFHALLAQVTSTPQETSFLTLLQHLLQVDPNDSLADVIWSAAEKLVHRASLLRSKEDADLLLRPPLHVHKLMDRLKSQHDLSSPVTPTASGLTFVNEVPSSDVPVSQGPATGLPAPPPPPPPPPSGSSGAFVPPPPPPPAVNGGTGSSGSRGPPPPPPKFVDSSQNNVFEDDPMPLPQQNLPIPKTRLKTFNWNKIPVHKVIGRDNLWTKATPGASNIDFGAMEELFACPQNDADKTKDVSVDIERKRKDSNEVNLLEPKRSLNVNIFLKQFRTSHETILDCVKKGKCEEIGAEKLRGLLKLLPEPDEIDMLKSYQGNAARLGTAEKFILQLIEVPSYELRIETMLFQSEFDLNLDYLEPCFETIIAAAKTIKENTGLHDTLHMVLRAGNFLNTGGYAGNAAGFKLSSLLKLADIRATKPNMNLLHYVVEQAATTNSSLLRFPDEMTNLAEAAKLSTETLVQEVKGLDSKCQALIEHLEEAHEEVQQNMKDFLHEAKDDLNDLIGKVLETEKLRTDLAEFFCEDVATFRLEDCFKTLQNFCLKFRKAVQENEHRKNQEVKAESRRQEEQEKLRRRQAAGELSDSAIDTGTSRTSSSGWNTMPRRMSDRSGFSVNGTTSDVEADSGHVFKRDTLESGYASDTGAKKRARKMIRSSDEDDLMEYLNQGSEPSAANSRPSARTMPGETLPTFGRHSLRSRPARSHDAAESRERSTSGAQAPVVPARQQHVEEWLQKTDGTSSSVNLAAAERQKSPSRPATLSLQTGVQKPSQNIGHPSFVNSNQLSTVSVSVPSEPSRPLITPILQNGSRGRSNGTIAKKVVTIAEAEPAEDPLVLSTRVQQSFQPNPIGYQTTEKVVISPTQKTQAPPLRGKWNPETPVNKVHSQPQPRPWLPSKTLANAMHVFDPNAGCPGEPLGSGTNSPASSSSENVQPAGGRSGEETDTDTINGSEKDQRKQLTATASQRLRKWRRLPATNGKSIDEEVMTDTSVEDPPRSGLSIRNQNPDDKNRKGRTLREMRESKRTSPESQPARRSVPWGNPTPLNTVDKTRRSLRVDATRSPPKSEAEDSAPVSPGSRKNIGQNVFDRLSTPKRASPPLERSASARQKSTVSGQQPMSGKSRRSGKASDGSGSDDPSHFSKSQLSLNSSSSSGNSGNQVPTKTTTVTLSSRPIKNVTRVSVARPGELNGSGRSRNGVQMDADGSFTSRVSDYTLASPESPKVGKAALVLSAPVVSRFRH